MTVGKNMYVILFGSPQLHAVNNSLEMLVKFIEIQNVSPLHWGDQRLTLHLQTMPGEQLLGTFHKMRRITCYCNFFIGKLEKVFQF
jgi:hypothetical protein